MKKNTCTYRRRHLFVFIPLSILNESTNTQHTILNDTVPALFNIIFVLIIFLHLKINLYSNFFLHDLKKYWPMVMHILFIEYIKKRFSKKNKIHNVENDCCTSKLFDEHY